MKVMVTSEEGEVVGQQQYGPTEEEKAEELKVIGLVQTSLKIEPPKAFSNLVQRLKGELGQHILEKINFDEMIEVMGSLIFETNHKQEGFESIDRSIAEYSLRILMCVLLYDEKYTKSFLGKVKDDMSNYGFRQFLIEGLFTKKSQNIRLQFAFTFYVLCKAYNKRGVMDYNYIIMDILLDNIPTSKDKNIDSHQFFSFVQ